MFPRSILLLNICFKNRLNTRLICGIRSKKPSVSVIKPGVNSNSPPAKIQIPSIMDSPGISPAWSRCCALLIVSNPCFFAKYAPTTPVKIMMENVGNTPIVLPDKSRTAISSAGMTIRSKINMRMFLPPNPI